MRLVLTIGGKQNAELSVKQHGILLSLHVTLKVPGSIQFCTRTLNQNRDKHFCAMRKTEAVRTT